MFLKEFLHTSKFSEIKMRSHSQVRIRANWPREFGVRAHSKEEKKTKEELEEKVRSSVVLRKELRKS